MIDGACYSTFDKDLRLSYEKLVTYWCYEPTNSVISQWHNSHSLGWLLKVGGGKTNPLPSLPFITTGFGDAITSAEFAYT